MRSLAVTVAVGLGTALGVGCTASADQVRPPEDQFYFPTGVGVAPDESVLFVANANSELRYDSGSISVLDLAAVDQLTGAWLTAGTIPDGCAVDPNNRVSVICDEARFMKRGAGVRLGNFATNLAVQDTGAGHLRLIAPTRGDPSISWMDWDGSALQCDSSTAGYGLCDDGHRLAYLRDDPDLGQIPDEPYDVFADKTGEFAVVTHLTTGAITLVDSPRGGNAQIADVATNLFAADPTTGLRGSTAVAGRTPGAAGDIIYVGSRSEDRVQTLTVGRPVDHAAPYILPGAYFFLDLVGGNVGSSADTRGMAFSPSGDRMYVVNRNPPSLQVYDTSLDETGAPRNHGVAATDLCREASSASIVDPGDGERAIVTCFRDGQIYVVNPRAGAYVEAMITVGRGPYAIVAAPGRKKLYVSNYLEDTVSVIDLTPGAPTQFRVVLRIGEPRT
jgi:DNA-binding beta-propeller fold protein YncE